MASLPIAESLRRFFSGAFTGRPSAASDVGRPTLGQMHKEDVKAVIRKKYGSLAAFERANHLGKESVTDVLRGGSNRRTRAAIEKLLQEAQ